MSLIRHRTQRSYPARRVLRCLAGAVAAAFAVVPGTIAAQPRIVSGGSGLLVDVGVRHARVARDAEVLLGGRAARVTERGLVVGAGLYSLATRSAFRNTYYGGLLLGYAPRLGPLAGSAAFTDAPRAPRVVLHTLLGGGRLASRAGRVWADNFVVAEPGVEVSLPLAGDLRLAADAGWRLVSGVRSATARNADMRGLTAGVGLQFVRF